MLKLPSPNTFLETEQFGWVYLEDISDDGIIVLRKPCEMTKRPNTLGLLTNLPFQYIYVHSGVVCKFTDGSIDDSIKGYLRKLRLP